MSYPNSVAKFVRKLNRRSSAYPIQDEPIEVRNGVGEAFLSHDNVIEKSIEVWTEKGRKGEKVATYILETPVETNWRTYIRAFTTAPIVYVSYETLGDQVEADDINALQDEVVATQTELDRHKDDLDVHIRNGTVDGGTFTGK